jgi:phage tail tape-measure protein
MRKILSLLSIALLMGLFLFTGCSTINKTEKTAVLGSAAGGAIGAMIGKRAGNTAVGATIGAVIGASTGAYIGRKLDNLSGHKNRTNPPLYVINGLTYVGKDAQQMLAHIESERIESVVILKTEDAVALYGNKGENGAVLISLKKI